VKWSGFFEIVAIKVGKGFDTKTPLLSSAKANEASNRMVAENNIFLKKIWKKNYFSGFTDFSWLSRNSQKK
jgi:hypothetical protein